MMKNVSSNLFSAVSILIVILAYHYFFANPAKSPKGTERELLTETRIIPEYSDELLSLKVEVANLKKKIFYLSTQLDYLTSFVEQTPYGNQLLGTDDLTTTPLQGDYSLVGSGHKKLEQKNAKLAANYAKKFRDADIQFNAQSIDYEWATEIESYFHNVSQKHINSESLEFGGFDCRESLCKLEIFNADFLGTAWTDFFQDLENGEEWNLEFVEMNGTPREGLHSNHEIIYRRKN
ncbi:MAG: hypothetical protein ACFHVJ_01295 [Aestuariibacter sp.]